MKLRESLPSTLMWGSMTYSFILLPFAVLLVSCASVKKEASVAETTRVPMAVASEPFGMRH